MISRLLLSLLTGMFLLSTFISSAVASEILRDELLLLESKTPYIEKTLTLVSSQTLQVTYDWSPEPENQRDTVSVSGKIIIVDGTQRFLLADFGETNSVTLDAGEYTLLVLAELESGDEANLILEVESDSESLISQSLRLAEQPDNNEASRFVEQFRIDSAQDVTINLRDDQFSSSQFIEPLQYAAVLVRSLDVPPTVFENILLEGGQEKTVNLGEFPAGDYEVNLIVKGSVGALSGLTWSLLGNEEIFNQSLLLNDDSELISRFIENIYFNDGIYDIKVVGLLGNDLTSCTVELLRVDPDNAQSIIFNQDDLGLTKTESLDGDYGLRVICSKDGSTALGIRIAENSNGDNVLYANALVSGDKRLLGSFELPLASSLQVILKDLQYLNLMTGADFVISDGADQNAAFSYNSANTSVTIPELAKGTYFVVADAETTGDALLSVSIKDEAEQLLLFDHLYAGSNNFYKDTLNLEAGRYQFSLVDHLFPTGASVFGVGVFSGLELIKKVQLLGSGDPFTTEEIHLEAGDYTLALILGQDADASLLAAYQVEQLEVDPADTGSDRGVGSNSGGSGGGGGGSIPLLVLFGLTSLAFMRRWLMRY